MSTVDVYRTERHRRLWWLQVWFRARRWWRAHLPRLTDAA